ncbi:MAG: PQQ-binding-like beta-propeller repeat protein [Verrucomicrobia bacterium]|nr:PQQ-binding-like beta-propeller repeat protein [Verrucomicrobiota bacterium]
MHKSSASRVVGVLLATALGCAAEADWARFRGPAGSGIGVAPEVPSNLTEKNFRWNTGLPGSGHASPVLWGSRVFTACQDPAGQRRCLTCLDADSGKILWTTWLPCEEQRMHNDNSLAAATPAVDAQAVYIGWVSGDRVEVLALDHAGKQVWRRDLGAFKATHGPGASVMLVDDVLVVTNDQGSADAALHGLDRKTGATRWRIARRSGQPSYATPALRQGKDGREELVVASPAHGLTGLDPQTGKQLWAVEDLLSLNVVASPVLGDGLVLATAGRGGDREGAVVAIDGDSARLLYRPEAKVPYVPSPIVIGRHVYLWNDQGTVSCLEFKTGKQAWSQQVTGPTYASPVSDGKRIFGISRKGELVVLAASPEFRELGRLSLPEGTHATPAIAHGSLFIRTFNRLLRVGP